jgi:hypothetical protein
VGHGWVRRWFDPTWYRYLHHRHKGLSFVVVAALAAALLWAGISAAGGVGTGGDPAGGAATYVAKEEIVTHAVTVRERGKVVVKRVPVVKTTYGKQQTFVQTQTISAPGQPTRTVVRSLVQYRPVYRRRIVTVNGNPITVDRPVTNTRILTDTQSFTVTAERTTTMEHGVTIVRTEPANTVTVVKTARGDTDTVTVVKTVRADADTVTRTTTVTNTETETTTIPVTVTNVATVTVTVPRPKP